MLEKGVRYGVSGSHDGFVNLLFGGKSNVSQVIKTNLIIKHTKLMDAKTSS